ncbi:dna mismatch repair protein mlh pms mutl [Holotrichia oblita]|uniref:Dna mismatch repair protein mlh pms mutl n=1 Tax=Holotrichia oblita TaxID=644536 RepID=A0ACB9SLP1_HOLOL|nr:dna mismatch repair protein mlh pms mutl [Holotrichia oblita]
MPESNYDITEVQAGFYKIYKLPKVIGTIDCTHIKTRNTVERQYSIWKRRFPILSLAMRVNNDLAKMIVVATAMLHNIPIEMKEPTPIGEDIIEEAVESYRNQDVDDNNAR